MRGEMISVKRLADSGKQFYMVESKLPDPKLQCITRSYKFRCNTRGFEDKDARSKALRFAITTDTLPVFRAFIFNEVDGAACGKNEGSGSFLQARADFHPPVGSSQEGSKRRIGSYICMRQNRLTGLRFVVAMGRLDSGRLRAVSFQDHSLAGASISDEALNKAVRFVRGVAFESWRKQATNELMSIDKDAAGNRRERALKHVSSFVEIEAGEKVDCACGKNRSRGLMVACERCGAWEHAECQGFRSDKQIPADYICSACMRAEREDVVVIRLEEQGECGNLQLEDLWTDAKIRERDADDGVCCVCGCEDNQEFEKMIPAENEHVCDGGTALVHPSCISAVQRLSHKAWNAKAAASGLCQLCGDRCVQSPRVNEEVHSHTSSGVSQSKPKKGSLSPNQSHSRNSRRAAKLDQTSRGAKRLRSALTNGVVISKQETIEKRAPKNVKEDESEFQATQNVEKMDVTSPEATKVGTTLPDRRFGDVAVTVPIKKRRLMMMEVVRSPSPPPRSPSPSQQVELLVSKSDLVDQKDLKDIEIELAQGPEDAEMVEVGFGEDVLADSVRNQDANAGPSEPTDITPFVNEDALRKAPLLGRKFEDGSDIAEMQGSLEASLDEPNHVSVPAVGESKFQEIYAADSTSDGRAAQEASIKNTSADGNTDNNGKDSSDSLSGLGMQQGGPNTLGDVENKDAGASSSASQSRSRDVRLHWDLNMDMEEWERPPEEDTGTFSGVRHDTMLVATLGNDVDGTYDHKAGPVAKNATVSSEKLEAQLVVDYILGVNAKSDANMHDIDIRAQGGADGDDSSADAGSVESKHYVGSAQPNSATKDSSVEEYSDILEAEHVDYDDSESRLGDEGLSDTEERVESEWRKSVLPGSPGEIDGVEEFDSELQIKVGRVNEITRECKHISELIGDVSESVSAEWVETARADAGADSSGLNKQFVQKAHIEPKECQDVPLPEMQGQETQAKLFLEMQEVRDKFPTQAVETESSERIEGVVIREEKEVQENKEVSTPCSLARRSDGQYRAKSSGWDQLPEGFDKVEDALRAAKESSTLRGRGSAWGGVNGRGASISPRGGPAATRFGRGRTEVVGDRARSEDSWTREDHQRVQRIDDNVDISPRNASPRELGRGRSHGRGGSPSIRGRGRMDPWMDSPGPSSQWGAPNRHLSPPGHFADGFGPRGPTNAATRALLKVESSGFVVAPDGTLTKAGGSSARGPPRPFHSGGRSGRGVIFNMGRGGPGMNIGLGMNLGGLRNNMGMGRGMGMGPGIGMNMGMGIGIGLGVGPGLGMPGRSGPGGRSIIDRYSSPYSGRGPSGGPVVESLSRRGRTYEDYNESWSRREDHSPSPGKRSMSRRSRSGTPSRSKSCTRSPKTRTPPRPANSSGSGDGVLGKSSKKRSHSPGVRKLEVRGERAELSPARRSVPPPPKLPLPPPPPRSQRSPPAGLRRLNEHKRDGDRARSRDKERERDRLTVTRTRSPPRRTSPHVVHGSALMDERDRQLLAGIRNMSPVSARNRSSENLGVGAVISGRDSPSLPSPVGCVAEGSSEARRQSGDEGLDSRIQGLKRDEVGVKSEQRSSKETSRGDRERIGRRDGARDRDEDRRDGSKFSYNSRDRDGRSSSSFKYNRDGDDDVAPRRRRPSP